MNEDRELDSWREQWSGVAEPPAEFQRKVQQRIKRQHRRFVLANLLTGIVFLGMLIFGLYMRRQSSWMGTGWAAGILALVFVSIVGRIWIFRHAWRPETQSTRAFMELWHKRVATQIRLLRLSIYLSLGWLIFCAVLIAVNWPTIGKDVTAHPKEWEALLIVCVLMLPVLWFSAARFRRHKLVEVNELEKILGEMEGKGAQ